MLVLASHLVYLLMQTDCCIVICYHVGLGIIIVITVHWKYTEHWKSLKTHSVFKLYIELLCICTFTIGSVINLVFITNFNMQIRSFDLNQEFNSALSIYNYSYMLCVHVCITANGLWNFFRLLQVKWFRKMYELGCY